MLAGQTDQAAAQLDRALALAPDFAPVILDWAAARMESGDPAAARRALVDLLAKAKNNGRAVVLLADARRALGEASWAADLDSACREDAKLSRSMRAACALESAFDARLGGERNTAIRRARSAAQASDDPNVLASAALALAGLGEIDAAADALSEARKYADDNAAALAWADLAIRLGRNQTEASPLDGAVGKPAVPERHMVALRSAFARGGGEVLAATIMNVPPALVDFDADLRVFSALGQGTLSRGDRAALEKRADRGNPVAAFVLGTLLNKEGNFKSAAHRLEKALAGHGDACQAGLLYVSALQAQPRQPAGRTALLRALHGRNAQCPLAEM
jgi:tetratricopeptide (TPR) repeat protein